MASRHKLSLIDYIIGKLPQIHLSGYRYCGPNTDLKNNLERGELGVNKLDCACMEHDIAYATCSDPVFRCIADKLLILRSIKRVYAKDSRIGERFAALFITVIVSMKIFFVKIEMYIDRVRKRFVSKTK